MIYSEVAGMLVYERPAAFAGAVLPQYLQPDTGYCGKGYYPACL